MDINEKIGLIAAGHMNIIAQLSIGESMEICNRLSTAEQDRDTQKFRANEVEYQRNMAMHTIDSQNSEIESLRAQLKTQSEELDSLRERRNRDKILLDRDNWMRRAEKAEDQLKAAQEHGIDRRFIEDCLIAYSAHCYFDGSEGLRNRIDDQIRALSAPIPAQQSPTVTQGELIKGEAYQAGLWSMANAEAMIEDGNVINGLSPAVAVPVYLHQVDVSGKVFEEVTKEEMERYGTIFQRILYSHPSPRITEQDRLNKPARVNSTNFMPGVPVASVIEAAQRYYEWRQENPPEKDDELRRKFFAAIDSVKHKRITEQDAREILENFCYEYNSCAGIDEWCEKEGRALLDKLNNR